MLRGFLGVGAIVFCGGNCGVVFSAFLENFCGVGRISGMRELMRDLGGLHIKKLLKKRPGIVVIPGLNWDKNGISRRI